MKSEKDIKKALDDLKAAHLNYGELMFTDKVRAHIEDLEWVLSNDTRPPPWAKAKR